MMGRFLKEDIKRYKAISGGSFWKEPSSIVILFFRIASSISNISFIPLRLVLNLFIIPVYRIVSVFVGISLPRRTKVGPGLVIFHFGAIAINENVSIGCNCTIRQGVTIGNRRFCDDVPIIGNNVDFGAGAVVIGRIHIGNNVAIGANAVVLRDVPDNNVAVGNPARIFPKKENN